MPTLFISAATLSNSGNIGSETALAHASIRTMDSVLDGDVWPLAHLRLRHGPSRLELTPTTDAAAATLGGIVHDLLPAAERYFTPGLSGRVGATRTDTVRNFVQRTWLSRGELCTEKWAIPFAAAIDGVVVGMQSVMSDGFPTERTVRTGSFLAPAFRGRGIGTLMRALVIEWCVMDLGATRMVTGYMEGNEASRRVSEHLGYLPSDSQSQEFEGTTYTKHLMTLPAERWTEMRHRWATEMHFDGVEGAARLVSRVPDGRNPTDVELNATDPAAIRDTAASADPSGGSLRSSTR